MKNGDREPFGRYLALALVCPLAISAVALALVIGHLFQTGRSQRILAVDAGLATAVTALVAVGAAAALRAHVQLRRVSREHARALKLAQEALAAREEFLTVASHELKTPLTSLRLQLGSALRTLRSYHEPAAKKLYERLAIADRQTDRLAQLVDELVDSSRDAEPFEVGLDVDLVALTRDVVAALRETLTRAGCEVVFRLPFGAVRGEWNSVCLKQALSPLLSNAAKYGRGRPIEIQVSLDGGAVSLSVRDQGIGIDPHQQGKIFERFERAVSPRNYGGFGLGLWAARRAVQALGGTIRVESRPGGGSTFTIELPRGDPSQPTGPVLPEQRFCS